MNHDKSQQAVPPSMFSAVSSLPKPRRRKWLLGLLVVGIVVILTASTALAFMFWYQNPNKVIADSLLNIAEAKSLSFTSTFKNDQGKDSYNITLNGAMKDGEGSIDMNAAVKAGGQQYTIKGGGALDASGNVYFRVSNIDELIQQYEKEYPALVRQLVDGFVTKINGKWFKISSDSLKQYSQDYAKTQQCMQTVYKKMRTDRSYVVELVDLYKQHPLYKVAKQLGSKNGSLGYEIVEDSNESKAFAAGLNSTKIYKAMHACDNSIVVDESRASSTDEGSGAVTLWISRWSHEITEVSIADKTKDETYSIVFKPVFNKDVTVTIPKDARGVEELLQDFVDFQTALFTALYSSEVSGGTTANDASLFSI